MSADMTKHPHWAVTVEASGEEIVRLETECYGGREISDADEVAIRTAAYHLLAFIGDRTFDMIECEAFHAGYEAGERDAGTPHPAPVTAREAEPTEDELDEAWKDGFNAGFGEAKLTGQPPQPSDTVAEAVIAADRFFREAMPKMNIADSFLDANAIDAWNKAELAISAALRALKGESDVR